MTDVQAQIGRALGAVKDPCSVAAGTPLGLDEMGMVDKVEMGVDGAVTVWIKLTSPTCVLLGYFVREIQAHVGAVGGVTSVEVIFDAGLDWEPDLMSSSVSLDRRERYRTSCEAEVARLSDR